MEISLEPIVVLTKTTKATGDKTLTTIEGPSAEFEIGIFPIYVSTSIPIRLLYSFDFEAEGRIVMKVGLSASKTIGMQYSKEQEWGAINIGEWDYDGGFWPSLNTQVDVSVGLEPTIELVLDSVATSSVAFTAADNAQATLPTENVDCLAPNLELSLWVNIEAQLQMSVVRGVALDLCGLDLCGRI